LALGTGAPPAPPVDQKPQIDPNTSVIPPAQLRLQEEFKLSNANINSVYNAQNTQNNGKQIPVAPTPAQNVLNQQLPQLIASLKQQKDGTSESLAHLFT